MWRVLALVCFVGGMLGGCATMPDLQPLNDKAVKTTLKNGLTVIISEIPKSSVVSVVARVKVGFFDEEDRFSGLSHLLEHMYFKGTHRRPHPEAVAQETKAAGGSLNAWTYHEETVFHVTLPASKLEQAIDIHADALTDPLIDAEQLKKETEVVLQEGRMRTDNPGTFAWEKLKNTAFTTHRVRRWLVGEDENLRKLTREDILKFHNNFYKPNNIILTISGGVKAQDVLQLVNKYYGSLPQGEVLRERGPAEPQQHEPRFTHMSGDIQKPLVYMAFPTVSNKHQDELALDVLSVILGSGEGARLVQDFKTKRQWVTSIGAGHTTTTEVGWFQVSFEAPTSVHFDETLRGVIEHIHSVAESGVKPWEIERARTLLMRGWVGSWETPLEIAEGLSQAEHYGKMDEFLNYGDHLSRITVDDIKRVARTYFDRKGISVVEYFPKKSDVPRTRDQFGAQLRSGKVVPNIAKFSAKLDLTPSPTVAAMPLDRGDLTPITLKNGIELVHMYQDRIPMFALSAYMPGGRVLETESTAGWSQVMAEVLTKGPAGMPSSDFEISLETLGASLSGDATTGSFGVQTYAMAHHWRQVLGLVFQTLEKPAFDSHDVEAAKSRQISRILSSDDNGFAASFNLLRKLAYGSHPYRLPRNGTIEAVKRITPEALKATYLNQRTLKGARIVVVGAVPRAELVKYLESVSIPEGPRKGIPVVGEPQWGGGTQKEFAKSSEKQQTSALTGFPGPKDFKSLREQQKLELIAALTGGLGGRFFARIRGENNLAYTVMSMNLSMPMASAFLVYTATSPENEQKAQALLMDEIEKLKTTGFSMADVNDGKAYLLGQYRTQMDGMGTTAQEIVSQRELGLVPATYEQYEESLRSITPDDLKHVMSEVFVAPKALRGILRGARQKENSKGATPQG